MLQGVTVLPPAPVCRRQTGINDIGHKNRDFHDKQVLRSKTSVGDSKGETPLAVGKVREGFREREDTPSDWGFLSLPNKTKKSKGNFPLKKKTF